MKVDKAINEEHTSLLSKLVLKDKQEHQATGIITTEILSKLNISFDMLPQKCQELVQKTAANQVAMEIDQLDPIAISLQQSQQISNKLIAEYEILKLKQKNAEMQVKIVRNQKFLDGLRKELECSRDLLANKSPNPENIHEYIKQTKQRVASYEEGYKKATIKFSKLSVPDCVLPKSLQAQLSILTTLREEEVAWKQRADDVLFTKHARDTFSRLRK